MPQQQLHRTAALCCTVYSDRVRNAVIRPRWELSQTHKEDIYTVKCSSRVDAARTPPSVHLPRRSTRGRESPLHRTIMDYVLYSSNMQRSRIYPAQTSETITMVTGGPCRISFATVVYIKLRQSGLTRHQAGPRGQKLDGFVIVLIN